MESAKEYRPRLSEEEFELIKGIRDAGKEHGISLEHIPDGWLKNKNSSLRFKNPMFGLGTDLQIIKNSLEGKFTKTYEYRESSFKKGEAVLKWSDLHFGAYIRNLVLTPDFDDEILLNGLLESVGYVNTMLFEKVHVHINGDLIESFSGLNHVNSWMSMQPDKIGANAVILCCDLLEKALSKIYNLGTVKIVAGNHDRTSKANDEDVKGGAAELIAWGLEKTGFDVEFHPMIITHEVEGINHINLHGHFGISKRPTDEILWKYGKKGLYNFIFEGHLHSIIQKLSVSKTKNFKTIKDEGIDKRRMHCPSFFTGNYYSETLGYDSNPGYLVVWDNGRGKPNVFNGTV
ncbi:MAG: hypothetical protein AAFY00_01675 [Bacteroidota bacterium]